MKKIKFIMGKRKIDECKIISLNDKIFVICGEYLNVLKSIIKLWNDGVNPKSYLSEIARDIKKDKSWVLEVINRLVENKIVIKHLGDGYKKKALYRLNKNIKESDIKEQFETKDYKMFDLVLLVSMILVDYLSISKHDMTLLLIWSIMLPIIELVLHSK